ncbi:hypothetical protein [Stigmatella erecta]|nr:hypothetical protein [Stigmatella erecta]
MHHLPDRHREFLTSALDAWKAHPGILGVLAGGSYLSRSMDAFSDLDLVLVVSEALRATIAQERLGLAGGGAPAARLHRGAASPGCSSASMVRRCCMST